MQPDIGFVIIAAFIGALALFFVYQLLTKGIDGWSFGANVLGTSEKIGGGSLFWSEGHLRVHRLKSGGRKWIGIKAAGGGLIGQEYAYVKLSSNEARRLVEALEEALDQT